MAPGAPANKHISKVEIQAEYDTLKNDNKSAPCIKKILHVVQGYQTARNSFL